VLQRLLARHASSAGQQTRYRSITSENSQT
jgi:hypothetical protein